MRARDPQVPERLTVSAGVALVKPHHPFHDAAALAERLCGSAKEAPGSTLDFHVLFDSVGSSLNQVRAPLDVRAPDGGRLRLWGGPYRAAECEVRDCRCNCVTHLDALVNSMTKPPTSGTDGRPLIGGTVAHMLRDALATGGSAITRAEERARLRNSAATWAAIDGNVVIKDSDGRQRSLWLDAVAVSDVRGN